MTLDSRTIATLARLWAAGYLVGLTRDPLSRRYTCEARRNDMGHLEIRDNAAVAIERLALRLLDTPDPTT